MPNTWQNIISDKVRISAAFPPIDEENTMVVLIVVYLLLKNYVI